MGADEIEHLVREAIPRYAKEHNFLEIGGSVHIRLISGDTSKWFRQAPPMRKWNYIHEFADAYWRGEAPLHPLPEVTRAEVDKVIKLGEKWSKRGH